MKYEMQTDDRSTKTNSFLASRYSLCLCLLLFLAVGIGTGILIGRFAICKDNADSVNEWQGLSPFILTDGNPTISEQLINGIDANNMRSFLKNLTAMPHLAGTEADLRQARDLQQFWKDIGLDEVFVTPYDVLLSYPNTTDENNMNQVQILNSNGGVEYASPLYEDILDPADNKSGIVPPFNAYSAPGVVNSTELIYVNYGRVEDYIYIENNTPSVNVSGKIVIARYGKIFRGDKALQASRHGAIGIILFSDPADDANGQTENVYPKSFWLPPTGTQRGTARKVDGDALTPGYPAIASAYRLKEDDPSLQMPTIPVHPIGYGIARELFNQMSGTDNIPADWKGAMNVTYRIGGPLKRSGWKVRMRISTKNQRRIIHNVFGIIKGAIEPDRYVLFGNHRDAWIFGAMDPSSGTAIMMETSRVMANLVKTGKWRPRRSIIFCSWGAEEYGLLGSTEWVEHYIKNLQTRAVAYINTDIAVSGNYTLLVAGSPLLNNLIYETTKKIKMPEMEETYKTLFDRWLFTSPDSADATKPRIDLLGSGSDFAPFVQMAGVPICDVSYVLFPDGSYPLYHTNYEDFSIVDRVVDPGFKYHKIIAQLMAELTRRLADDLLVPFSVTEFSKKLTQLVQILANDFEPILTSKKVDMNALRNASVMFSKTASAFQELINNINKKDPFTIRKVNDQLILLEKAFLDPQGLPGRPLARHVLFADSIVNSYAGSSFPGLVDALFEIEKDPNQEERWNVVKKHFSVLLFTIESAASTLLDVTKFISTI